MIKNNQIVWLSFNIIFKNEIGLMLQPFILPNPWTIIMFYVKHFLIHTPVRSTSTRSTDLPPLTSAPALPLLQIEHGGVNGVLFHIQIARPLSPLRVKHVHWALVLIEVVVIGRWGFEGSMRLTHKKTVISHKLWTHFWSSKLSHKKRVIYTKI